MNTVRVLLANSDRRLNNLVEVAVRDVCYDQLLVECATTGRLDELLHRGCMDDFGLIFVAPDHLVAGPPQRARNVSIEDASQAVRAIKNHRSVPIIAVGVRAEQEMALLESGAESVFGILMDRDRLRSEVRRTLRLRDNVAQPEPEPSRWSFGAGLLRGLQRLRQN